MNTETIMLIAFYVPAALAVIATALAITAAQAVHALLYLILSLLSVAMVFLSLGAPFPAALEVIVYAGAILVLFVFVVMLVGHGPRATPSARSRPWKSLGIGPPLVAGALAVELAALLWQGGGGAVARAEVDARRVGSLLFGPYLLAVEAASFLLLAGLVGAFHLGRGDLSGKEGIHERDPSGARAPLGGDPLRAGSDRRPGAP